MGLIKRIPDGWGWYPGYLFGFLLALCKFDLGHYNGRDNPFPLLLLALIWKCPSGHADHFIRTMLRVICGWPTRGGPGHPTHINECWAIKIKTRNLFQFN